MKKKYEGIDAAKTEKYDKIIQGDKRRVKAGLSIWQGMTVAFVIACVSTGLDCLTLFTLFDKIFLQSAIMVIAMSLGIAVVLDTLPLVIAKYVHWYLYKLRRHAGSMLLLLIAAFCIIFIATVILRFSYKDQYGDEYQSTQLVNSVSDKGSVESEETPARDDSKSIAVVLLLSLSPLVTSIVTFGIAYASDDEVKNSYEYHVQREHEIDEAISDLEAAIETMNINVQRDIDIDEQAMLAAEAEVISRSNTLKSLARHYLAEFLADPSATSRLSQEMLIYCNNAE